jgi:hypothetical protein
MAQIINTRSPFYIKVSDSNLQEATLTLHIYSGNFISSPTSTELKYTITKSELEESNYVVFEIAELIRDYILNDYYTGSTTTNCVWVKATVTAKNESGVAITSPTISPSVTNQFLAVDGYGYFDEGSNPEPSRSLLQSNTIVYRPSDHQITIPVFREETNTLTYFLNSTQVAQETIDKTTSTDSTDKIVYVKKNITPSTFNKVVVNYDSGGGTSDTTINVFDLDCSKYTPIKVSFINKLGALQEIWFDKRSNESIEASSNTYKASVMDFSTSTPSYNTSGHQDVTLDLVGKESIVMNTGYIDESHNEVFRQLILSELVWMQDPDDSSSYLPLRPKTQSLQFKTRVNDKLVNYTVEFDFAFDKINTIR